MKRLRNRDIDQLKTTFNDHLAAGAIDEAMQILKDALTATRTVRLPRAKGEPVNYGTEPDHGLRMAAAKTILEFKFGKPRQSIQMTTDDAPGRQRGRDEVMQALKADWERTKQIGDTWLSGMRQAEEPETIDIDLLDGD